MNSILGEIKKEVYDKCNLKISEYKIEKESKEYGACRFVLNGKKVIGRNAKVTPKKVGQFVTLWKRFRNGPIEPMEITDPFDYCIVNVSAKERLGQFIFPKSILIEKGIIASENQEGKRAFRVYPPWDLTTNKQALNSQKWQMHYFYEITTPIDLNKMLEVFKTVNQYY